MLERVFVYGTLRSGGSNSHRMQDAKLIGAARVNATLYRVDWYPGLKLKPRVLQDSVEDGANETSWVLGEIYEVDRGLMAELDAYEGAEYRRVSVEIQRLNVGKYTRSSDIERAYVWEYIDDLPQSRVIESGDWLNQ